MLRQLAAVVVLVLLVSVPAWATEVLVSSSTVTQVDASKSRTRTAWEVQNLGPNPIYCETKGGTPVVTKSRKVASGETWSGPPGAGDINCKAATADQVTGAATIYMEST